MNDELKDQFEATYTKEDIVAIRKLMFRKKYGMYFAQNGICLPLRIMIGFFGFPFYTLLGALAVSPFPIYKIIILAHREA